MPVFKPTTREKRQLMVVSHTHWDREWYLPYQAFRVRLVGLFDALIELFESDPNYRHFMLDGHTIPLEDYLEVRPDRFDEIQRLVQEGRLLIGPWYIIPDEFLPGGEALVRNFLRGHRVAKLFGPVMKVGYIPDPFGQIAHMPAILNGFGIRDATMWRGADESLKTTEFFWRSPDGSEVLTVHKPMGYGIGGVLPRAHRAFMARLDSIRDDLEPLATTPYLLVMNGGDHLGPQPELSSLIENGNNGEMEDAVLQHSSLPEVLAGIRSYIVDSRDEWPVHEGEFRSGQRAHLLPGVLSARMWIKQVNQECEDLLSHWAEPFSLWADALKNEVGSEWKEPLPPTTAHMPFPTSEDSIMALVDRAWRHLLENQPHDSICGCSVDAVHDEMGQRYDWVREIGEEVARRALRVIGALAPNDPNGTIAVFNPTPQAATGFVTTTLPWDDSRPVTAVIGPSGERIEAHQVGTTHRFVIPDGAPSGYDRTRADVGFVAHDVPGYGYKVYRPEFGDPSADDAAEASDWKIENEYFSVEVDEDATLVVGDKRTGRVLRGLNRFVDGGDRGDEYNYCPPENDVVISRAATTRRVHAERVAGRATLVVEQVYRLPRGLSDDRRSRSDEVVEVGIISHVSLTAGVPRVDVTTTVENAADDHRLRVHFNAGVAARESKADQHFGVVSRPVALPDWDRETWMEEPLGTYPQKAFVSVDDGVHGLSIANRGLPEYEVVDAAEGSEIAITLLRCVGWLSRDDLSTRRGGAGPQLATPGAQMHGAHTFNYSIIPHAGDWVAGEAHVQAVQHLRPMRSRFNRHGMGHIDWSGELVKVTSPAFHVSAIKRAEDGDGIIVRVYNTLDEPADTYVDVPSAQGAVSLVNLNEDHVASLRRDESGVGVNAKPNQIITLRFKRE